MRDDSCGPRRRLGGRWHVTNRTRAWIVDRYASLCVAKLAYPRHEKSQVSLLTADSRCKNLFAPVSLFCDDPEIGRHTGVTDARLASRQNNRLINLARQRRNQHRGERARRWTWLRLWWHSSICWNWVADRAVARRAWKCIFAARAARLQSGRGLGAREGR